MSLPRELEDLRILVAGGSVFLGCEERCRQFPLDLFGEVLLHAVGEAPLFGFAPFNGERDFQSGQQHGLAAQQTFKFAKWNAG